MEIVHYSKLTPHKTIDLLCILHQLNDVTYINEEAPSLKWNVTTKL